MGTVLLIAIPVLFFLMFFAAVLTVGMWERQPIRTWRPETPMDDPMPSDYADIMNAQAGGFGFAQQGIYRLNRPGRLKHRCTFWMSPQRDTIALVNSGGIGAVRARKTMLISHIASGRYLVTVDEFGETDLSGVTDIAVMLNADFGELVAHHQTRLRSAGTTLRAFTERSAEEAYANLITARRVELERRGLARTIGDFWKYTPSGALRLSTSMTRAGTGALKQKSRATLKRPGDKKYIPRIAAPNEIVEAELVQE